MSLNSLTQNIQSSLILGPLVRMAQRSHEDIADTLHRSPILSFLFENPLFRTINHLIQSLVNAAGRENSYIRTFVLFGVMCLFTAFTFCDTGPIGLLTWGLLGLSLIAGWMFGFPLLKRPTIIDLLFFAFLGSAAISTAFSSFEKTSLIGLSKMMTFGAGYFVFRNLFSIDFEPTPQSSSRTRLYVLLGTVVILGLGETLIGLYQYINHIQPLATWEDPSINAELKMNRIFGTLLPSNPNLLAGFLIPCFASALGLTLIQFHHKRLFLGLLLAGVTVLILLGLGLTGSRGGYLAIFLMLSTSFGVIGHLLWHDAQWKKLKTLKLVWLGVFIGTIGIIIAAIAASPSLQHRIGSIFAMRQDSSNAYRMNVYQSAFQMVKENPVVGIGPGNGTFKLVYGLYMVPGYNALGAYSVPLEIAVEQGVIGLSIFLLLLVTLLLRTLLFIDSERSTEEKLIVFLLFLGLLGSFVYGFFDTIWYRPAVNLMFWFYVATLANATEPITRKIIRLNQGQI